MSSEPNSGKALLSFYLGPVQPFIEAAKTTRDLWAGSYILSWMTFRAMREVIRLYGEQALVSPSVERNPLFRRFVRTEIVDWNELTTAGIPNKFLAVVPPTATWLPSELGGVCRSAWREICQAVRKSLEEEVDQHRTAFEADVDGQRVDLAAGWLREWDGQVDSVFEIRAVVVPVSDLTDWDAAMRQVAEAMDAVRSVRHVPPYIPKGDPPTDPRYPQKCTVLGTYEQLGPAELKRSRMFWEVFADTITLTSTRTRRGERLSAPTLVKRFAWPAHFRNELGISNPDLLRYSDTATVAAKPFLRAAAITPDDIRKRYGRWNGQWLFWSKPDQGDDKSEHCPTRLWDELHHLGQTARRRGFRPSAYYAVLVADGDRMGELLQRGDLAHSRRVSQLLDTYATGKVVRVVETLHSGELVYAGGDDATGFLPSESALAAAHELHTDYRDQWPGEWPTEWREHATLSCGIAIVHYKEDLRVALQQARAAEKRAKNGGRNRLGLTVCRRSGEHTTADCSWEQADKVNQLVRLYVATDVSDRWAYKFRELLPTLGGLTREPVKAELNRLLGRLDGGKPDDRKRVTDLANELFEEQVTQCDRRVAEWLAAHPNATVAEQDRRRRSAFSEAVEGFVTLAQSASFMARGRDH